MTNKEAINIIQEIEEDGRNVASEHIEALALAIKALEERQTMNNDLISCEYLTNAIDTIKQTGYDAEQEPLFDYVELTDLIKVIYNAPTVEVTERPQGKWEIDTDNIPICTECGEVALQRVFVKMPHLLQEVRMVQSNYCPNCGADMRDNETVDSDDDMI